MRPITTPNGASPCTMSGCCLSFQFKGRKLQAEAWDWSTILNKRENYRKAFDDFHVHKVAAYGPDKVKSLLADAGIVRNRSQGRLRDRQCWCAFLKVQQEFGTFDAYIWRFVDGKPIQSRRKSLKQIPSPPRKRIGRHEQRPQTMLRLSLRRQHDVKSPHAGHRYGQRPPHHLPSPQGMCKMGKASGHDRRRRENSGSQGGGGGSQK